MNPKIGLGGGCHWCTEGIFQKVTGVQEVQQGWISSDPPNDSFSEAILFEYDPEIISLETLIEIHLHSHSSSNRHSMRSKYRSAIYVFNPDQEFASLQAIKKLQSEFTDPIITEVLPFREFKLNDEEFLDYYQNNPQKPFCQTYIDPKLSYLMDRYSNFFKPESKSLRMAYMKSI